ncbi:hypothetical protein Tco_0309030 [Tanacetum coccineum]
MPLWKDGSLFDSSSKNASNDEPSTLYTNVNTGSLNINIVSPTVTTAPLEATHADFFGDETEVDMSNITTTYPVPSTPNTRIHKDYSLDHVIGDIQSGVLTRRMTKASNEQGAQKGDPSIKRSKLDRSYARRASIVQVTTGLDLGGFTIWHKKFQMSSMGELTFFLGLWYGY